MATKAELIKRCEEMGIDHSTLSNNEEREAAIKAKEAEIAATAQGEKETTSEEAPEASSEEGVKEESAKEGTESSEEEEAAAAGSPDAPETSSQENDSEEEEEEEAAPEFYRDDRDRKWKFKKNAPKSINIAGHPMSQEDILKSEDVMAELVYGKSNFLTLIQE